MAEIIYVFSRVEPILKDGMVQSWVVGLSAQNSVTGVGAYIDSTVIVDVVKSLAEWTKVEIFEFCQLRALQANEPGVPPAEGEDPIPGPNWFEALANRIEAQEQAPIRGAPVDLSAKKMKYKGAWEEGVEYLPTDIVKHEVALEPDGQPEEVAFEAGAKTKGEPGKIPEWKPLKRARRGREGPRGGERDRTITVAQL